MANYVEYIQAGTGEAWPVRDAEAHDKLKSLTTVCKDVDSWNDAIHNGFYASDGDTVDDSLWWGIVISLDENNVEQHVWRTYNSTTIECRRSRISGVWNTWEYVFPPMEIGVEYRTTERYKGAPVYKKVVSYTTSASLGTTMLNVDHNINDFNELVAIRARVGTRPMPVIYSSTEMTSVYSVSSSVIQVRGIGSDFGADTMYFELSYTKTVG